jgi:pimeloyl-ACP methyl ester carboxylesterase
MTGCDDDGPLTRRAHLRTLVILVALAVLGCGAGRVAAAGAACNEATFSVRVANLSQPVGATLCRKTSAVDDRTLVITAHGATYNRTYWDWPQSPESYSIVRKLAPDASVLNVDLLGSGRSGHPPSSYLTLDAEASMLHQLVQTMRTRGFRNVILLGHSSGSGTVTQEAATYHDVDGIVVTGFLHRFPGLGVPLSFYPAMLDPAFAGAGLDPGYLTTRPGSRATNGFYNAAVADPSVIAYDEAHKDVVPWLHTVGFPLVILDPSISRKIDVPVLSLVGDHDPFCESPACPQATAEPAAWSSAARLELHAIANAGHDIHLHGPPYADAEAWYIRDWLARRFAEPRTCPGRTVTITLSRGTRVRSARATVAGRPAPTRIRGRRVAITIPSGPRGSVRVVLRVRRSHTTVVVRRSFERC